MRKVPENVAKKKVNCYFNTHACSYGHSVIIEGGIGARGGYPPV